MLKMERIDDRVIIDQETISNIACKKHLTFKSNKDFKIMENKAAVLGGDTRFDLISPDLGALKMNDNIILMTNKSRIEVYDGYDLFNTPRMHSFSSINLTGLDTSNMKCAIEMFSNIKNEIIGLNNLDTHNVECMRGMFSSIKSDKINLSNFDVSKVMDMRYMFIRSTITELDISNFNINTSSKLNFMFYKAQIGTLKLFDIKLHMNISDLFSYTNIETLILNKIDIEEDQENLKAVLEGANIGKIVLLDTSQKTLEGLYKMLMSPIREDGIMQTIGNLDEILQLYD